MEDPSDAQIKAALDSLNAHKDTALFGPEIDEEFDTEEFFTGGVWFQNDKGYYKIENGKQVPKPWNEAAFLQDCKATLAPLDANVKDECTRLIQNLAAIIKKEGDYQNKINELVDQFVALMARDYGAFKDVAKNLHPHFVKIILRSFGFVQNEYTKEVVSVNYWLANILKNYLPGTEEEKNARIAEIKKKENNLLNFLNLMVHYINANPGLLNPGTVYDNTTYEERARASADPDDPKGLTIDSRGYPRDRIYNIRFRSYKEALEYVRKSIQANKARFERNPMTFFRFQSLMPSIAALQIPGYSVNRGFMYGGGSASAPSVQVGGVFYQYQVQQFNNLDNVNCSTKYSEIMFKKLKSRLAASNKKLHDNDEKNFKLMMQNLKKAEDKLYQYLSTFSDYVDNSKGFNPMQQTVSKNDMARFVDGLKNRGMRYLGQEEKLIDALWRIANAIDGTGAAGEAKVKETPIPLN